MTISTFFLLSFCISKIHKSYSQKPPGLHFLWLALPRTRGSLLRGQLMQGRHLVEMQVVRWKGSTPDLGFRLPAHLSRTTLMVLRPRAAAIWMTACPTPLLAAFWMTESPVDPGRDQSQALETCNKKRPSSLRSYYIRQEMECSGSKEIENLAAEPS